MREGKKNKKQDSKIVPFGIDKKLLDEPDMDWFLKEHVKQEVDALEEKLNNDPKLKGLDAREDMFQSIVSELKKQGVWEEESPNAQTGSAGKMKDEPASLEEIYAMLPEDDLRALKLGRQIEKKQKARAERKKRRRKMLRYSGTAAAVLVVVLSVSMTSEANRRLVRKAWDGVMYNLGFRVSTNYSDEESGNVRSVDEDEIKAMEEISEALGISAITFDYLPEGMEYQNFEIMEDALEGRVFYTYLEKIFTLTIVNVNKEGAVYYALDNEPALRDRIINSQELEAKIWEVNLDKQEETYIAEMNYGDGRYFLNGMIPLEELKKIVENAIIL